MKENSFAAAGSFRLTVSKIILHGKVKIKCRPPQNPVGLVLLFFILNHAIIKNKMREGSCCKHGT